MQVGDMFRLNPATFPAEVSRLIHQQNNIGWRQLFLGLFGLEWSEVQDAYYARETNNHSKKALTGHRWQVIMIGEIRDQWRILWSLRNQELHGSNLQEHHSSEHGAVHRDLRDIYDGKALMEPSVQALLYPDATHHLSRPT